MLFTTLLLACASDPASPGWSTDTDTQATASCTGGTAWAVTEYTCSTEVQVLLPGWPAMVQAVECPTSGSCTPLQPLFVADDGSAAWYTCKASSEYLLASVASPGGTC